MTSLAKIAEADMSVCIARCPERRSHLTVLWLSFESEVAYRMEGYTRVRAGSHPTDIRRARARPSNRDPRGSGIAEVTARMDVAMLRARRPSYPPVAGVYTSSANRSPALA